jgi:hypothetical protein
LIDCIQGQRRREEAARQAIQEKLGFLKRHIEKSLSRRCIERDVLETLPDSEDSLQRQF